MRTERKWGRKVQLPATTRRWSAPAAEPDRIETRKQAYDSAEELTQEAVSLINASGRPIAELTRTAGLGATTIQNWRTGKTRRANTSTLIAALRPLGYNIGILKEK